MYVLIGVSHGRTTASIVDTPRVPEGFVGPGEVAFIVEALDVQAMHTHQTGVIPISRSD